MLENDIEWPESAFTANGRYRTLGRVVTTLDGLDSPEYAGIY